MRERSALLRPRSSPSGRCAGQACVQRLTSAMRTSVQDLGSGAPSALVFSANRRQNVADRSARILLVDDEQSIQTLLSYPLRRDGYEVVQATDGRQALDRFDEQAFDLVVLDLMLPKVDGLEVCRRLRSRSSVPIIMLTAKSEEIDKVVGLELGADDYITKPFSMREFSSRIKAALRRVEMSRPTETAPDETPLEVGNLRVDFPKRTVRANGQ